MQILFELKILKIICNGIYKTPHRILIRPCGSKLGNPTTLFVLRVNPTHNEIVSNMEKVTPDNVPTPVFLIVIIVLIVLVY